MLSNSVRLLKAPYFPFIVYRLPHKQHSEMLCCLNIALTRRLGERLDFFNPIGLAQFFKIICN